MLMPFRKHAGANWVGHCCIIQSFTEKNYTDVCRCNSVHFLFSFFTPVDHMQVKTQTQLYIGLITGHCFLAISVAL